MKKFIAIFAIAATMVACNDKAETTKTTDTNTNTTVDTNTIVTPAPAPGDTANKAGDTSHVTKTTTTTTTSDTSKKH